MAESERAAGARPPRETANDSFKKGYGNWVAGGIIAAVAAHFALFVFVPKFRAADIGTTNKETEVVTLPPEVKIPPPPKQIARPATPKVAAADIKEDVTIAPTTFEENPVKNLPPPPEGGNGSERPSFIPYDVAPRLKNQRQVQQVLQRNYPSVLKDAGIGGTVLLWVYIDESGKPQKSVVKKSSGYPALDAAAKQVAQQMDFTPAQNRDKKTPVWIQIPINFSVK